MKSMLLLLAVLAISSCTSNTTTKNESLAVDTTKTLTVEEATPCVQNRFKDTTLTYPGSKITFTVSATGNTLNIKPSGLTEVNNVVTNDITGYSINKAEIGDLNIDGYPEVFVYLTSDGSGSYGKLIGYSVNNGKSMSQVYLSNIADDLELNKGYRGHDEMAIIETSFCQRFPIYKENDTNASPTGGTRQIQYKMVNGETGRILKKDKVVEF